MKKPMIKSKRGRRFDEGGEVTDKAAGLEASNKEAPVGFFERLRMGNIDDPSSEAYKRFGAGRGRAERIPVADVTPTPVVRNQSASAPTDDMEAANAREPIPMGVGPKAEPEPVARPSAKPKPEAKKETKPEAGAGRGSYAGYKAEEDIKPSYGGAGGSGRGGKGGPTAAEQELYRAFKSPSKEDTQKGLETAMGGGPGLKVLSAAAKSLAAKNIAKEVGSRALANAETPVTFLGKSGARQMGAAEELSNAARQALSNNPTRQLSAPAAKKAVEETKKLGYKPRPSEADWTGGAIGYRKGGSVSKASSRADGIAQRGKTRGAMR